MTASHPSHVKPTRPRVEWLDPLRMIAVLAVVLFHYGFRGAAADGYTHISLPELESIAKYGYLGVQMFFVISGFVIAYSAEGRTSVGFAIARITRIYPGFLFCMTLTFLISLLLGGTQFKTTIAQWAANVLIFAPALKQPFMDGAYWSIVYELVFYGWVCLLIALGLFRRNVNLIVLLWLAVSMLNEVVWGSGVLRKLLLTDESGFFAAGILLYQVYAGRRDVATQALFGLAVVCATAEGIINVQLLRDHYGVAFDSLIVAGLCLAAIAAVAIAARIRQELLPSGIVLAIGGLTYPLYLLHQHIGFIVLNRLEGLAPSATLVAITTLLMITLAWATWRYIERPGQRWLKAMLTSLHRSIQPGFDVPAEMSAGRLHSRAR